MTRTEGFTLVELLVAVAILSIIGVMALSGLTQAINQQSIIQERSDRWREVQFAMQTIYQDLSQVHPRPTREEFGESWKPALQADPRAQFALELSRGGWTNPAGFARGTVLRVAYDWEQDILVRFHWPVMDRTLSTLPTRTEILRGVKSLEIRFLDHDGQWHRDWPPITTPIPEAWMARPRAIEFGVELKDFGNLWRVVEISG
ncbi:MAG: type II secretion system minor pseudopilin GspJ [Gammaproteobacteria bacterium]